MTKSNRSKGISSGTGKFFYFAYGSNMLDSRLKDRCNSASKIKPSTGSQHLLKGWKLNFSKESRDRSGKGNICRNKKRWRKSLWSYF